LNAPKAFIIHLERAAGRRPAVDALRANLEITSEILAAVDGRLLSESEVTSAYGRAEFQPRYPFALGRAEIGAFLSHRAAWRRIVAEGLDFAVVFEDDAAIDPRRFSALLTFLTKRRGEWGYVLTPAAGIEPRGEAILSGDGLSLIRPHAPPLRAIGQLVSHTAAERLLAVTERFDRPVDTFLQMAWITGVPILSAVPTPLHDVSGETGGTTVQRRRIGAIERLRHEILRPVYRARVLSLYRRELAKPGWRPAISAPDTSKRNG
jgi:glycosyl transferase, family 25